MNMNKLIAGGVVGVILLGAVSPTIALPLASNSSAVKQATPETTTNVYWRGRGWGWGRGGCWGCGWGVAAGAVGLGLAAGAAAAYPYYGYGPGYYGYGPGYYGYGPGPYYPAPAGYAASGYGGPPSGDAVGYCMQRFRSYDPRTGTYLGNDGLRHPCP